MNDFIYVRNKENLSIYLNSSKIECIIYDSNLKMAKAITESGNDYIISEEVLSFSLCSDNKINLNK